MKNLKLCFFYIAASMLLIACSKSNDGPGNPGGNNGNYNYGPGNIYIKQGTEGITKINMRTGDLSGIMNDWADAGWDISWDGKKGVKQVNASGFSTITTYVIFNVSDGSTIKEVKYEANGGYDGGLPCFSPDGTKLALVPTFDDGLVILDMSGNVLRNIAGYGNHRFDYLAPIYWAPDGTILFQNGSALWRTTQDFSRASKVRDIPFSDWKGYGVAASPDGKKIAVAAGKHIWLMNADGSDFHAVTESDQEESKPSFSPDSKYLAIAANSRAGEPGSGTTAKHLCLVPADGQVYKVWPGEDKRVIQLQVKGTPPDSRGLGETIVGDFVWRP